MVFLKSRIQIYHTVELGFRMSDHSRRDIMLTCVCGTTTILAGCSSGFIGPNSGDDRELRRKQVLDKREEIAESEYEYFSFSIYRQTNFKYEFTVRSGPEIDVYLVNDQEFERFEDGNQFKHYSSKHGGSGSDSVTLAGESYRFVIDNTSAGKVTPPTNLSDDIADVEVKAWVER